MEQETFSFEAAEPTVDRTGLSIHAGFPNPSEDASPLSLDFNQLLVRHPNGTFVFRVRGHEWLRLGIWDGDLAVVDRLLDARSNDIVVWCREGEAGFGISSKPRVPTEATSWGVVVAIIHETRKSRRV